MSVSLMGMAFRTNLNPSQKIVMLAFCDRADDNGGSLWPSIGEIALKSSMSERQTQRIIKALIGDGWLAVVGNEKGGAGRSRRYRINVETLSVAASPKKGDILSPTPEKGDIQGKKGDIQGKKGDIAMSPDTSIYIKDTSERVRACARDADPEPDEYREKQDITLAFEAWNETATALGLAVVQKLTDARKSRLRARLRDCGGIAGWRRALQKIGQSKFLRGDSKNGWRADFDFVLQEKSFTKLMEGAYADKDDIAANAPSTPLATPPEIVAALRRSPKFTDDQIRRWIDPCHVDVGRGTIEAPSAFTADQLNQKYDSVLRFCFGRDMKITVAERVTA